MPLQNLQLQLVTGAAGSREQGSVYVGKLICLYSVITCKHTGRKSGRILYSSHRYVRLSTYIILYICVVSIGVRTSRMYERCNSTHSEISCRFTEHLTEIKRKFIISQITRLMAR